MESTNINTISKKQAENFKELVEKIRPRVLLLWKARKRLIIYNIVIAIITISGLLLFAKPYYIVEITILPEYGSKAILSGVTDIASLAGISVGDTPPTEIYGTLIYSEAVLSPVIYHKYQTEENTNSINLVDYFEYPIDNSEDPELQERKRFLKCYDMISKNLIKIDYTKITKILNINVRMPERQLSADVSNKLIESLEKYITTKRKSYASNQRYYIELRIKQVADSLKSAEEKMKQFREQNRIVNQSPQLILEENRISRNMQIQQTIFVELTKQVELAKIEEIKETPVLNIKDKALNPVVKAGPRRILYLAVVMLFSLLITFFKVAYAEEIYIYINVIKGNH